MRFPTLLIPSLLINLLALSSHAQTAPSLSRFYLGVSGNQLSNAPFNGDGIVPRIIGPALTVGMQLTPRLAVQTGLSYHWKKESRYYQSISTPGGISSVTTTQRTKYFIIPALLRYMVTAPAGRAHFDVVGGATLLHATGHVTYDVSGGAIDPALRESSISDTRFNLTLGPAVRAAISPRLELSVSSLMSMVVGDNYYRFSDRLFLNTSIGLNYTFGQF
jgi:hypothetical protein